MTERIIPDRFVWTKMQAAAGEPVQKILRRKELERQAGNGFFWWGIGESKGKAVEALVERLTEPEVLFSLMLSPPTAHDSDPDNDVAVWEAYDGREGRKLPVPPHVIVTSGAHTRSGNTKRRYYALVCHAARPLHLTGGGTLNARELCNIGGKVVGSSQVTAAVERQVGVQEEMPYDIDARASLAPPHVANLVQPRILNSAERRLIVEIAEDGKTIDDWLAVARRLRHFG